MENKRLEKLQSVAKKRQRGLVVVLEDMHDPHNAAAVLRSCDAFGVQDVYFIFNKQAPYNPKKIGKLSSASANKWLTTHIYTSVDRCCHDLKMRGFVLFASALDPIAKPLHEYEFTKYHSIALICGNEKNGISKELLEQTDNIVYIPMHGFVQSLNLSVTAGIMLHEVVRQRIESKKSWILSQKEASVLVADFEKL